MADNTTFTPGLGGTLATDEIGGVHYTRTKIALGGDGVAEDMRGNVEGTLLASAARTATTASATQTNVNARGVLLYVNVTAAPGSQNLSVAISGIDPVSGSAPGLGNFTAITATGAYTFFMYPGIVNTHPTGISDIQALPLPRTWAVIVTHSGAGSWTYSIGYSLIV